MRGPQVFQQTDGHVVVDFTQVFETNNLDDSLAVPNEANPHGSSFPLENTALNEVLLDSTALAEGGGSANAFLFEDAGGVSNLCLRFVSANGIPVSDRIIFARESVGHTQQNPAVEGLPERSRRGGVRSLQTRATSHVRSRVQVRTADGGFATGVLQASAGDQNAAVSRCGAL